MRRDRRVNTIGELPGAVLRARLSGPGLDLVTGGFRTRIQSPLPDVAAGIAGLYGDFPVAREGGFADFHVAVTRPRGPRRWHRPQVLFRFDGRSVFKPLPLNQAFPMLEWGLNWCVTTQVNHFLLFHAAVVARGERALVMPGQPGSGKSTLCAALVTRGWRLLSDELAMVDLESGDIHGLARPVSLKNESLPVLRALAPDAFLSAPCHDTLKGTVAHLRPPADSVRRMDEPARPAWIVFPKFEAGATTALVPRDRDSAFFELARNSFNYSALGTIAFERTVDLVAQSDCHDLTFSDLDDALARLGEIAGGAEPADRVPGPAGAPG
ncbi:MAG: HprK-related kinase A [Halofilum sp. (in: g-proteobacteria)]|nr:HprK-related kinase A [Halofilum sp. (in: g-proteobacteria)]